MSATLVSQWYVRLVHEQLQENTNDLQILPYEASIHKKFLYKNGLPHTGYMRRVHKNSCTKKDRICATWLSTRCLHGQKTVLLRRRCFKQ